MTAQRKPPTKSSAERTRAFRERQRAKGLRLVQFWTPDLRNPQVVAQIRREIAQLDKSEDEREVMDFIESHNAGMFAELDALEATHEKG